MKWWQVLRRRFDGAQVPSAVRRSHEGRHRAGAVRPVGRHAAGPDDRPTELLPVYAEAEPGSP